MDIRKSIDRTRMEFEKTFAESSYYDSQTQDEKHLELIRDSLRIENGSRILDLGTGSGYLAFPIAKMHSECTVIGLDIVEHTLEKNRIRADKEGLNNLRFVSYNGLEFPFEEEAFDIIVCRYAIHHFPDVEYAFKEMARVLSKGGQLFISDPTPNDNDTMGFVDSYMKTKPDGHIRFYRQDEVKALALAEGLKFNNSFTTKMRFPRKDADKYRELLLHSDRHIVDGYDVQMIGDEVYITEQVMNISFIKD